MLAAAAAAAGLAQAAGEPGNPAVPLGAQVRTVAGAQSARPATDPGANAHESLSPVRPPPQSQSREHRELSVFFLIGIVINVVVMSLFALWMRREWKKHPRR